MFLRLVACTLITSLSATQTPVPAPPPPPAPGASITVPAGTAVQLALISPIRSRSTRPGSPVRAVVSFPVTVGAQVAIPAGTYVLGTVIRIHADPLGRSAPIVNLHLTSLVFENGSTVPLDALHLSAQLDPALAPPGSEGRAPVAELADAREGAPHPGGPSPEPEPGPIFEADPAQEPNPPALPPLKNPGPSEGVFLGVGLGGMAALFTLGAIFFHRRAARLDYVVFDGGWPFEMVLSRPLTLYPAAPTGPAGPASPAA